MRVIPAYPTLFPAHAAMVEGGDETDAPRLSTVMPPSLSQTRFCAQARRALDRPRSALFGINGLARNQGEGGLFFSPHN
jgi:hypothetical protein